MARKISSRPSCTSLRARCNRCETRDGCQPLREDESRPFDRLSRSDVGAPDGTRTHDLQVRNLTLYPLSYGRALLCFFAKTGGEGGIRTLEAGYPTWRFSKPLH